MAKLCQQEAQLPQRNSASAAHIYLGWLTDHAMHRTRRIAEAVLFFDIQMLWFKKCWQKTDFDMK